MTIKKYITLLIKIKKLFKSSGKGVLGMSKTAIGMLILILPAFGLEQAAEAIKGQEVELSGAVYAVITGIGTILTAWGAISKQEKIEGK